MTAFAFSVHTYPDEPEKWLKKPVGKYKEIIQCALEPSSEIKQIDLCCGLGFGKTLLAIQIAALKMDRVKGTKILFLEPDWDRVQTVFLDTWIEHVPPELYHHDRGRRKITWKSTGAFLHYRARVITGSRAAAQDKRRGVEYTDVIDDETALGFDETQYQNTFARIRGISSCRCYITLTTPRVGPYGRFLKRGGNIVFRGRTADNFYHLEKDPGYEKRLRALMSKEQARRELDGELVALEGRVWKDARYQDYNPDDPEDHTYSWPNGNRHDDFTGYDKNKPYWLLCDLGSSTGSYVAVQQTEAVYMGRELFHGPVWVAVADYCPDYNADAANAFTRFKDEMGSPIGISGGADIGKRSNVDGRTVSFFAQQVFSNVPIYPCSETIYNKQMQFNRLLYLICSVNNERRFTIARDFKSFDDESHRGVREMIDEDQWPAIDERRESDFLPKGKDNIVQHTRDALLMGTAEIMKPPRWGFGEH